MEMNRQTPTPLDAPRTRRVHSTAVLTSMPAGKMTPLHVIPLLREDAMSGTFNLTVEMSETKELLMNPVHLRVMAYVVPFLAFQRFEGSRDQFDRSWSGQPKIAGGATVNFFETQAAGTYGANAVYKYLGLHAKSTDQVNTAYLEAYNAIWNLRAQNRSPNLALRTRLQSDLAPAFWNHGRFEHIVPDFDQAIIDGQISLNVISGQLAVKTATGGTAMTIAKNSNVAAATKAYKINTNTLATGGLQNNGSGEWYASAPDSSKVYFDNSTALYGDLTNIVAELNANGVSVSLSNLELARQTQAFAEIRRRYNEIDESWIIDMLMSGLEIPDQMLKDPILLADKTVSFEQLKRYSSTAGSLSESAVSGGAQVQLNLRVPQLNTGGVVMIVAEAVPEQLFERQQDPLFFVDTVSDLPNYLRDTLDPEKVDVVKNNEIDTEHATPNSTFGYAPLNWKWTAFGPRVGGKFYRPQTNTGTDTVRQRLWAVENTNPVLGTDFYIVTSIHQKPFLDTASDPFEVMMVGEAGITGLTVFGQQLVEATGDYAAVLAKAPQTRIVK